MTAFLSLLAALEEATVVSFIKERNQLATAQAKSVFSMESRFTWLCLLKGYQLLFVFFPASVADLKGFEFLSANLPKGSLDLGDKAYYSRRLIEKLGEKEIFLLAAKRKDSKTPYSERVKNWIKSTRQRIETYL